MFFWKCSKLNVNLENTKRNSENIFIYQINASENVAINYVCSEENTCHQQSMG